MVCNEQNLESQNLLQFKLKTPTKSDYKLIKELIFKMEPILSDFIP